MEKSQEKKKFKMPHIFILLVSIIIICAILTWILPAGEFERVINEDGRAIAVAGTYHTVESSPVGPFQTVQAIYKGMVNAAPVIFFVFVSFASIGLIIDTKALNGLVSRMLDKVQGRSKLLIIPLFFVIVGAMSSTIGVFEEMMPFIPVFVGITLAMNYDAIVGMSIIALGIGMGYSGAVMNPFTVGMAQSIAEVPLLSGSWYRIICHIVMIIIASIYVMRYAIKVEKNPESSLVYGDDFSKFNIEDSDSQEFGIREKLVLLTLVVGIGVIVYGSSQYGWYFDESNAVFLIMGIVSVSIMGWGPNKIAERMAEHFSTAAMVCMMIGIARGILVVLTEGNIIDTVVYGLSLPLENLPKLLIGPAMLVFQTLLNFFIPSGSGQAVTSMPIMAPLADLLGVSRQVSVLAFQFGDGLSNILWPTTFAPMIAGLGGVKLQKWWKFFVPLFLMLFVAQSVLLMIAIAIGYN